MTQRPALLMSPLLVILGFWLFPASARADACAAVEREMVRGAVALEDARDQSGYLESAKQFRAAVDKAPKCAQAHYNLGLVFEKASAYSKAAAALKRYLELAPEADDAKAVKRKIYALEYRAEQKAKQAAAPAKPTSKWAILSGQWCGFNGRCGTSYRNEHWQGVTTFHNVTVDGDRITIVYDAPSYNRSARCNHIDKQTYQGTIDASGRIEGTFVEDRRFVSNRCYPREVSPPPPNDFGGTFTGTVSDNVRVIRLTGHGRSRQSGQRATRNWDLVKMD